MPEYNRLIAADENFNLVADVNRAIAKSKPIQDELAKKVSREEAISITKEFAPTPDLSPYVTKSDLTTALNERPDKLTVHNGGVLDIGTPTEGKILGFYAKGAGVIGGTDVLPGEIWIFVGNGQNWIPFQAGAGGGSGASGLNRPVLRASNTTETSVTVTWGSVSGATSYEGRINGGQISTVISPWNITNLLPSSSNTIDVRSVGDSEQSAWSTIGVKTLTPPPASLELGTTDASIVISSGSGQNDSTVGTNVPYGKYAHTKKTLLKEGFAEFEVKPTSSRFGIALNNGAVMAGTNTIGVYVDPSGAIMLAGGTYAGGVDSKSSTHEGNKLRLGRSNDVCYIEQYKNGSWVRLGAQAVSGTLSSTKLLVFGPPSTSFDVRNVAGVGWF